MKDSSSNIEEVYLLSGIAPSAFRRYICVRVERQKQSIRETLSLFDQSQLPNA